MSNILFNCSGKLVSFNAPIVMGVVNATPNSFYNQGRENTLSLLIQKSEQHVQEGAAILDIGGWSSKFQSEFVSIEEEWSRIKDLLSYLKRSFPSVLISVDTFQSEIAYRSVQEGADIVNDISAGELDAQMLKTVAKMQVPYIAMHMQGTPKTMQINPTYQNVVQDILNYFIHKIAAFQEYGIKDYIIDVGFGFGKTIEQNYELLKGLHQFQILKTPILAGLSRKSMIYKLLETTPDDALLGTAILNFVALQQGASILRVHDVKEAVDCIKLWRTLKETMLNLINE